MNPAFFHLNPPIPYGNLPFFMEKSTNFLWPSSMFFFWYVYQRLNPPANPTKFQASSGVSVSYEEFLLQQLDILSPGASNFARGWSIMTSWKSMEIDGNRWIKNEIVRCHLNHRSAVFLRHFNHRIWSFSPHVWRNIRYNRSKTVGTVRLEPRKGARSNTMRIQVANIRIKPANMWRQPTWGWSGAEHTWSTGLIHRYISLFWCHLLYLDAILGFVSPL